MKTIYVFAFVFLLFLIFFSSYFFVDEPCLELDQGLRVCAASDIAKITRTGKIPFEVDALDISKGELILDAARNETIAFQLLLKTKNPELTTEVKVSVDDFIGSKNTTINSDKNVRLFKAHYHWVEFGGYNWGTKSEVLDWPDNYPDALIPLSETCSNFDRVSDQNNKEISSNTISIPEEKNENQSVWIDIFIPKDQPSGEYKTTIKIQSGEFIKTIPLTVKVWDVTLPDKPTIEAVGELYDSYKQEGLGRDFTQGQWKQMSHCYQQMAHRHRMVFIERLSVKQDQSWQEYNKIYDPILNGSLFTEQYGYVGPGINTPVSIWRTPWPQNYNARVAKPIADQKIVSYEHLAKSWLKNIEKKKWDQTDFFAYIFDEVDGATDEDELGDVGDDYIEMVHQQMDRVQKAIDKGMQESKNNKSIDLIWTSHTDPQTWEGIDNEDLKDVIRLWSPSANSANVDYLTKRKSEGNKIWFYHSGHPAVGIHSINTSGIEMRTWGVITAKYNFDGHFMWALNLSDQEQPFRYPSYKKDDDRFGNGTMVYAGNKLDTIGIESNPGPIPTMRLKAWRRGLQDAELIYLARKAGYEKEVNLLIEELIPAALSEGKGSANWSDNPQDWIKFHRDLLNLASDKTNKKIAEKYD
ncbi:MAG: glycoside hydrolase domain-containing protein [Gammaproteobacteria bacterium]